MKRGFSQEYDDALDAQLLRDSFPGWVGDRWDETDIEMYAEYTEDAQKKRDKLSGLLAAQMDLDAVDVRREEGW